MMNAHKYLVVDRSLDSEKEVAERFQMGAPRAITEFDQEFEESTVSGVDGEAPAPQSESSGGRSMWRTFFGWLAPIRSADRDSSETRQETQAELSGVSDVRSSAEGSDAVAPSEETSKRSGRSFLKRNPFVRRSTEPVQAEFRFEHVKVVCNELHDTDFIIKT